MKKKLENVDEFHQVFKIGQASNLPVLVEPKESKLRFDLMKEENEEYIEACENDDIIEIADALGDQLYILCGTILKHGLQHKIDEVFEEIHRSNMSKLDENGEPIFREDGKVLKGKGYFKPNIRKVLGFTDK
jgi:predicted HAD superfamily Cof-like phosphohydrolase